MVSDRVTIFLGIDADEAFQEIAAVKGAADEQARLWKIQRNTILRQIREGFTLISSLMSSARMAFSLIGAQIDPFFSALIGMVLSTASMLISAASTLALTGVGGVAAAVLFGLAIGFQVVTIAKLIADKERTDGILTSLSQAIASGSIGGAARQAPGGLGGFG